MIADTKIWHGACHCKAVRFSAVLPRDFLPHRCNCSICSMKSTIVIDLPADNFKLLAGNEAVTAYKFQTKVAKHWFCSICGIHTFQNLRSDPDKMSVNAACLDGFDVWALETVPIHDGRDNHPTDTGMPRRYSAVQRLEYPADN
ncbi:MAG: GFA family protein [Pontixanthobacter sp.]